MAFLLTAVILFFSIVLYYLYNLILKKESKMNFKNLGVPAIFFVSAWISIYFLIFR